MMGEARYLEADRSQLRWDMVDLESLLVSDHRARVVWGLRGALICRSCTRASGLAKASLDCGHGRTRPSNAAGQTVPPTASRAKLGFPHTLLRGGDDTASVR